MRAFLLKAAQEAAQNAQTPEKEETAEAISCPSRSRTDEVSRTEHPDF
jgi:hypothetical protein